MTLAALSEHGFFFLFEEVERIASALLSSASGGEDGVNAHCANAPHYCKFYASVNQRCQ